MTSGVAGVRICICACVRLRRPTRVGLLAADVFDDFTKKQLRHLIERHGCRRGVKFIQEKLMKKFLLRIMSCLQLASKIINVDDAIKTHEVKKLLAEEKVKYSTKEIVKSEYKVFKIIGFQVPLRTRLDVIESLIEACTVPAGLDPSKIYESSFSILKLVYLLKDEILHKWKWAVGSKRNSEESENCGIEDLLPAAIVAAACKLIYKNNSCIIDHLAENIHHARSDIKGLADIVLIIVLE